MHSMDIPLRGSVTGWIDRMKAGDAAAADPLWQRYFERLVALARKKLPGRFRRARDEEDVALSALHSLCTGAAAGRFHVLCDRASLWRLLVMLTARKAAAQVQHQSRQKRGGARVRGDSAFDACADDIGFAGLPGPEPTPEVIALMREEIQRRLDQLGDASLREVALLTLEGWTNEEMAQKMNRSTRSIERKLAAIRKIWQREE
jgi:DNA-directed RNA polymerase specialized sigma24 family protein